MTKWKWVMIVTLITLMGCQSNDVEQSPVEISDQVITDQVNNEDIELVQSLENKLVPPKFVITDFAIDYLEEEQELLFNMDYEIDPELYNILTEGNQEMHFILEYPENIIDLLQQTHSDAVIAETPSNDNSKYQVTFILEIALTEAELNEINDNISNFNLLIADRDKDIIAQFIDIYGFNQYRNNE
ncbi:hypothetical protein [Amphibacillus sediminis]|uniref:hypothetical protein n=1 Tax=Amphibacillus sediminis TaxID=360185 RepID=UPI000829B55F|nr:hypothetical protein [Amphibacillus sediminis]